MYNRKANTTGKQTHNTGFGGGSTDPTCTFEVNTRHDYTGSFQSGCLSVESYWSMCDRRSYRGEVVVYSQSLSIEGDIIYAIHGHFLTFRIILEVTSGEKVGPPPVCRRRTKQHATPLRHHSILKTLTQNNSRFRMIGFKISNFPLFDRMVAFVIHRVDWCGKIVDACCVLLHSVQFTSRTASWEYWRERKLNLMSRVALGILY